MKTVTLGTILQPPFSLRSKIILLVSGTAFLSSVLIGGLNVAGYIVKENAGHSFLELVHLIGGFSRIVELP